MTTTSPTILASGEYSPGQDPLPSWNEGSTKQSILGFVRGVTKASGPHFVKPEERIAVFDNDGTLWGEQPFYFQGDKGTSMIGTSQGRTEISFDLAEGLLPAKND
jgi:hypothetical protein